MDRRLSRRHFLHALASITFAQTALSGQGQGLLRDRFFRDLHQTCTALRDGNLDDAGWRNWLIKIYNQIDLPDLLRHINFDSLTRSLALPQKGSTTASVDTRPTKRRGWGAKIFANAEGTHVPPHGHNDMVSAHLVLKGSFHVRTYNRRFDLEAPSRLVLEPVVDRVFGPGELLTMSDDHNNIHWLEAVHGPAYTFDVPVTHLNSGRSYANDANRYSMIFVDPRQKPNGQGLIEAPIISVTQALARF